MNTRNLILLGRCLLTLLPAIAQAQYTCTTNNGAITIVGYTGTSGDVDIPATINGYPVTSIGGFFFSTSLTNITLPASVTNIASEAFEYQSRLTNILVAAQNPCYSSSNGVLFNKNQTLLVMAPGGIAGTYPLPGTVTSVGDSAFAGCAGLSGITLPTGVTNIGNQSFDDCGLTSVAIGPNVVNLGSDAFGNCANLTAITVDANNLFYHSTNGILFDKGQATLLQAPGGMTGSYAVPAGVMSIGAGAFSECNLTGISMPGSVTNIGSQAFNFCVNLTNVTLGTNLISIGDSAFDFCGGLTNLTIPNRVTSIGYDAFETCSRLTGITLGTNLTSIAPYTFQGCSDLGELFIPNSVLSIGSSALYGCGGLTNITLGTNVAAIGDEAFENCSGLTSMALPASMTNLGNTVFAGCGSLAAIAVDEHNPCYSSTGGALYNKVQTMLLQVPGGWVGSYALPNSVTNIAEAALAGCGQLTAITAGGQNQYFTSINGVLFDKGQSTLVQFPGGGGGSYTVANGITRLGDTAFDGCSNLTRITIPASVTNVGYYAFAGCPSTAIYFGGNAPGISNPSSGTSFPLAGNYFYSPFYDPNAEAVYYLPGATGWSGSFEGLPAYFLSPPYVCTTAGNAITISGFNGSGGAIAIPDQINGLPVTAIGDGAFDNAAGSGLTNIILGTNITSIGTYAFAACASLTSITLPNGVTNLGSSAFTYCDNLKSVIFLGNAPSAATEVFFSYTDFFVYPPVYAPPSPTTIYYLPGTTGWGATFDGEPAVLWNPQAATSDGSFGVRTNGFGFHITGASNLMVVVEAATSLSSPDWQPVQTLTLTNGPADFRDPEWTNYPGRYYRLRSP